MIQTQTTTDTPRFETARQHVAPGQDLLMVTPRTTWWSAIVAGACAAMAIQVIFAVLGAAIGMSVISSSSSSVSDRALSLGAAVYWLVSGLVSLFIGGWVAGRLRLTADAGIGAMQGFLAWGLITILSAAMMATIGGAAMGGSLAMVGDSLNANLRSNLPGMTGNGGFAAPRGSFNNDNGLTSGSNFKNGSNPNSTNAASGVNNGIITNGTGAADSTTNAASSANGADDTNTNTATNPGSATPATGTGGVGSPSFVQSNANQPNGNFANGNSGNTMNGQQPVLTEAQQREAAKNASIASWWTLAALVLGAAVASLAGGAAAKSYKAAPLVRGEVQRARAD